MAAGDKMNYEMPEMNKRILRKLSEDDVAGLVKAHTFYGDSWKRRGGIGAFMMLARKFDRIENQCLQRGYDIFAVIDMQYGKDDGILDDIRDLRRYLLLVEQEMFLRSKSLEVLSALKAGEMKPHPETSDTKFEEADSRYVDQDPGKF